MHGPSIDWRFNWNYMHMACETKQLLGPSQTGAAFLASTWIKDYQVFPFWLKWMKNLLLSLLKFWKQRWSRMNWTIRKNWCTSPHWRKDRYKRKQKVIVSSYNKPFLSSRTCTVEQHKLKGAVSWLLNPWYNSVWAIKYLFDLIAACYDSILVFGFSFKLFSLF